MAAWRMERRSTTKTSVSLGEGPHRLAFTVSDTNGVPRTISVIAAIYEGEECVEIGVDDVLRIAEVIKRLFPSHAVCAEHGRYEERSPTYWCPECTAREKEAIAIVAPPEAA